MTTDVAKVWWGERYGLWVVCWGQTIFGLRVWHSLLLQYWFCIVKMLWLDLSLLVAVVKLVYHSQRHCLCIRSGRTVVRCPVCVVCSCYLVVEFQHFGQLCQWHECSPFSFTARPWVVHGLMALFLSESDIQLSSDCISPKLHTQFHMLGTKISELGHEDFHNFHTFHL